MELFRIPVYKVSVKTHRNKIAVDKDKYVNECIGRGEAPKNAVVRYENWFNRMSAYENYCIGYISVQYDNRGLHYVDMTLHKNATERPKICLYSNRKYYMFPVDIQDAYTSIRSYDSKCVAKSIKDTLKNNIHARKEYKNLKFDYTQFDLIADKIDYKAIFNQICPQDDFFDEYFKKIK